MSADPAVRSAVGEVVGAIEAELRTLQLWSKAKPSSAALASDMPFCCDTLELSQWLQWIFLPRMREILAHDLPLPEHSGIYPLAEELCAKLGPGTVLLLRLIQVFDALIEGKCSAVQMNLTRH